MKNSWLFFLTLGLLLACRPAEKPVTLTVSNPLDEAYPQALVVLDRASLGEKFPELGEQGILAKVAGTVLPQQLDDLDGDGRWDELAVLLDLPEAGSVEVTLGAVAMADLPAQAPATNLRMAAISDAEGPKENWTYTEKNEASRVAGTETETTIRAFQMEGPGWENERVGFRNYFDERNGIDIFGKQASSLELVLDQVGTGEDYHALQEWGMDILKVGTSLGAGGLALQYQDSLYRVTDAQGTYRAIAEGPVRAMFDLDFPGVAAGEESAEVKHRISIVKGEDGFRSEVYVSGLSEAVALVVGIVNMETDTFTFETSGGAALLSTHDQQAYTHEWLGLGLAAAESAVAGTLVAPETGAGIIQTYALEMPVEGDTPLRYFFMSGWELTDAQFADPAYFRQQLARQGARFVQGVGWSWGE